MLGVDSKIKSKRDDKSLLNKIQIKHAKSSRSYIEISSVSHLKFYKFDLATISSQKFKWVWAGFPRPDFCLKLIGFVSLDNSFAKHSALF